MENLCFFSCSKNLHIKPQPKSKIFAFSVTELAFSNVFSYTSRLNRLCNVKSEKLRETRNYQRTSRLIQKLGTRSANAYVVR